VPRRGTCNTGTGLCSNPNAGTATTCNDGNACTQTDTCQSGRARDEPVICTPLDQCHDAGRATRHRALLRTRTRRTDRLQRRQRLHADRHLPVRDVHGSNPVTCTPLDRCHVPGTCNPGRASARTRTPATAPPAPTAMPARRGTRAPEASAPARPSSATTGIPAPRTAAPAEACSYDRTRLHLHPAGRRSVDDSRPGERLRLRPAAAAARLLRSRKRALRRAGHPPGRASRFRPPLGGTDTIIQRQGAAYLPTPGSSVFVPIEIVGLSLVSATPITVNYGSGPSETWKRPRQHLGQRSADAGADGDHVGTLSGRGRIVFADLARPAAIHLHPRR
jgi:hypothetical protein